MKKLKYIFAGIAISLFLASLAHPTLAQVIVKENLKLYQKVCESYGFINSRINQDMAKCVQLEAHRHQNGEGWYHWKPKPSNVREIEEN